MIDRRFISAVLILAAIALASQILLWLTRPRPDPDQFSGPPRSGYTLENFTLNALDDSGKLALTVSGPRLARHAGDGSIHIASPDYVMVDSVGNPWVGTSTSAWVNKDGSIMRMEGDVRMERTPSAGVKAATITTSELTARPKDRTIQTDARTQIAEPGSILRGTGMRGDLNTKALELLSDVHNTFEPSRRRTR